MIRLLLEVLPRIIIAVLLFSIVNTFINTLSWRIIDEIRGSPVEVVSLIASLALSIASLIHPTPLLYVLAIALYSIATRFKISMISLEALLSIGAIAVIDHLKSFYRNQQEKFIEISRRAVASMLISVSVILTAIIAVPLLVNAYLLSISPQSIATKTFNSFLREIAVNPIFVLSISLAIGIAIYRITTIIPEVIAIYVGGSRDVALRVLRSRRDVDVYIETPLTVVKSLALSAIFTPPIYAVISMAIPLSQLQSIYVDLVRGAVATTVFVAMGYAMYRLEKSIVLEPKSLLVLSLVVLLLIYIGGAILSYNIYRNVIDALTKPLISYVMEKVSSIYIDFYTDILVLLDGFAKLFGVAP